MQEELKSKALAKENWFKGTNTENKNNQNGFKKAGRKSDQTKDRKPPSTVMFVPNTKGGLLVKKMKRK
jgi:hypothetical protein